MNEIRPITSKTGLEKALGVLKELRPQLDLPAFERLYRAAHEADGYTLVGLFSSAQSEAPIAVMGYRVLHDFAHGRHLYVDDLVTTAHSRSCGAGAALLKFSEEEAARLECNALRLCTGIENERGKKFYEREGWMLRAVAYKKPL